MDRWENKRSSSSSPSFFPLAAGSQIQYLLDSADQTYSRTRRQNGKRGRDAKAEIHRFTKIDAPRRATDAVPTPCCDVREQRLGWFHSIERDFRLLLQDLAVKFSLQDSAALLTKSDYFVVLPPSRNHENLISTSCNIFNPQRLCRSNRSRKAKDYEISFKYTNMPS